MNATCSKCLNLGLEFYSNNISPVEYIEGNPNADIWIIGLNPKNEIGHVEERTKEDFKKFSPNSHPYFYDFKKVSNKLYDNWLGENNRIAHTDLVKCFSNSFPPEINIDGKLKKLNKKEIIKNCSEHLYSQIQNSKPKVIICNGAPVSWEMVYLFPPKIENVDIKSLTSYKTDVHFKNGETHQFWIVLSGFIGRIDDWSKRRLGKEIEEIFEKEEIKL
ncbi:MAG: uracil-DNA glycosylase family protein [Flavobacteriaceae bacterium]|nr:uracil-DNA glycosylase family protein [Flavobacteriaceae bacterium]